MNEREQYSEAASHQAKESEGQLAETFLPGPPHQPSTPDERAGIKSEFGVPPEADRWQNKEPGATPPEAAPLDQPQQIGRYRIEKVLGEGGFGRVYLAHDDQLNRPVAIKVPRPERLSQPGQAEAYLAEARVVASLDHPNIVPVHDVGTTDDGLCYVVSKFIEGSDLAHKIQEARPSNTQAAELMATVAEALHYAHRQGLVHRGKRRCQEPFPGEGRGSSPFASFRRAIS